MALIYTIPSPDEALVITGGLSAGEGNRGKVVTGRGAFHIPMIHKVHRFYIGSRSVRFQVEAQSAQNIAIEVEATVVFRVSNSPSSISEAAVQFLNSSHEEMRNLAADIFSGQTRAIIGKMSVEEIISDRDKLNIEVLEATEPKLAVLGLKIDNFQINQISDRNGHIQNLSKPELEKVRERAERAQAEASSSIEEAQQKAEREKSLYKKETDLQVSQNTIETAAARAKAKQSEPLAEAEAKIDVAEKEREYLEVQALSEKARLNASIITEAHAKAEALKIEADAEAEAIKVKAEAISSHNGIVLTQELLDKLPSIVESYAMSLSDANVTVFNGSEGLTKMLTETIFTSANILESAKLSKLLPQSTAENTANTENTESKESK